MSGKAEIKAGIRLEGEKEFQNGISAINKSLGTMQKELGYVSEKYKGQANTVEALSEKQEVLTKILDAQKQKVEKTKSALEAATKKYDQAGDDVKKLKEQLEDATKELDDMKKSFGTSSDAVKEQQQKVDSLTAQLGRAENQYQKAGNKVEDWKGKLATANTQVIKANNAVEDNAKYLDEAKEAADGCATSIDSYGNAMSNAGEESKSFADTIKEYVVGNLATKAIETAGNAIIKVAGDSIESASNLQTAVASLTASTGISTEAAEKYKEVISEIKGDDYGDSYQEVADVMSEIIQTMGELDSTQMVEMTESAMALSDTFGIDVNESIRAVSVMVSSMGVDAETAFDLIARGAQNGLNRSGELADNLTEYGSLWGQAGFSAEEAFGIMENGLDAGAYNLDKVNDFVKEFTISLSDGRIEENLGSFSEETQQLFQDWKDGKATSADVFYSVINDLSNATDKQEALTIASDTWSSLGEDNAMDVITALGKVNDSYSDVQGTVDTLKETKYDTMQESLSQLGAAIQQNITTPLGEKALPVIQSVADKLTEMVESIGDTSNNSDLENFLSDIQEANDKVEEMLDDANKLTTEADFDVSSLETYKNKLIELNEVEDKSEFQKYQLKSIVEELSSTIPELADAFDEETGSVKLTTDEITNLFEANENLIKQKAYAEALTETYEALAEAELTKAKADSALEEAQEQYNEAVENWTGGMKSGSRWHTYIDKYSAAVSTAQNEVDKAADSVEKANGQVSEMEEVVSRLTDTTEDQTEAQEENTKTQDEAADATEDATDSIEEETEALEENAEAAADVASAADTIASAAQTVADAYSSAKDSIQSTLEGKISLSDMFDGGADITTEDMNANLQSFIDGITNYQENLQKVREMTDENGNALFSDEVMQAIEDGGTEYANALQHMVYTWENQSADGYEQVKGIADKWATALDMSEQLAESEAANEVAIQQMTGALGSSDADFSTLRKSIQTAVKDASSEWSKLETATVDALNETVDAAQAAGVEIPEGLADAISSGSVSAEDAVELLNAAMQGRFEGLAEIAQEVGVEVPESLQEGIEAGGAQAQAAIDTLSGLIADKVPDFAEQGKSIGDSVISATNESLAAADGTSEAGDETAEEYASGLEGSDAPATAGGGIAEKAVAQARAQSNNMNSTGSLGGSLFSLGLLSQTGSANSAGSSLGSSAYNGANNYTSSFNSIGYNMASGLASGIYLGQSLAIAAAQNVARRALEAAKEELDINSPSKKFRKQVGQQISAGLAFGISDKESLASAAASAMSKKVYQRASKWLESYKKKQKASVSDEEWYWNQILKHVKKGTAAYKRALNELRSASSATATSAVANSTYILSSNLQNRISSNFGVSRYETDSNGKKTKKEAEDYYSEIYQAAQTYFDNKQTLNEWDLEKQLAYWTAVKAQLKSGSQAWYDATEQINNVQSQIAQEAAEKITTQANVQQSLLDKYKTYYKMSSKAEMEYWDIARKQFKEGTDERIAADEKYLEAKQEYYDEQKELDENYADDYADIVDELNDQIEELTDAYKDAVSERKNEILSSMDLFESWDADGYDADTLLYNLKTQVAGLALWEQQLEELGQKGLTEGLMEELKEMGPDAAANIYSLNQMTAEQLEEYNKLWEQKNALAESQAIKDNEELLEETNAQISQLKKSASQELKELTAEYKEAVAELNTGLTSGLEKLVRLSYAYSEDAVAGLIAGIKDGVSKIEEYDIGSSISTAMSTSLVGSLKETGTVIGQDALSAILDSLTNPDKISEAASETVECIKYAFQEEIERQKASLAEMILSANAGVSALNAAAAEYGGVSTTVNVDNSSLISAMQTMMAAMQSMVSEMTGMQMVVYPDTLAGELQPYISQESASASIRMSRGNL